MNNQMAGIKCENGEALLLSDIVLDKQKYNKRLKKVTGRKVH